MKLLVLSHKEVWANPDSPSGYSSTGGFPFQMLAISELFDHTTIIAALRNTSLPNGARPITGHGITVHPLPEPPGSKLGRKIALLLWLPRYLPEIWRAVRRADAVHAPVPGDVGTIGILVALAQRKRLFVRHCSTWGKPVTLADRFLLWLLERIAGGHNVVLATGGNNQPPSRKNPHIHWIFSTALTERALESIHPAQPWQPGQPLRLVTVGRLAVGKNVQSIIRALYLLCPILPKLREDVTRCDEEDLHLHILGDGKARSQLERLAHELGIKAMVTFHGNVSHAEVLQVLSHSHLFVFPSVREGFPKAVLEALACGLPVVATNVSAIPYLIRDCGVALTDTGPQAVAEAVLELLDDPQRMAEMSARARERARQYTLERWRDEIRTRLSPFWKP